MKQFTYLKPKTDKELYEAKILYEANIKYFDELIVSAYSYCFKCSSLTTVLPIEYGDFINEKFSYFRIVTGRGKQITITNFPRSNNYARLYYYGGDVYKYYEHKFHTIKDFNKLLETKIIKIPNYKCIHT